MAEVEADKAYSSSGEEGTPFVRRCSKRKITARTYTLEQVAEIVGTLPEINETSFKIYHKTTRQQKKARARARQLKVDP